MINLMLVNKENILNKDYMPNDLYTCDENENNFHDYLDSSLKPQISKQLLDYLKELQAAAFKEKRFNIVVDSGYRSFEYQKKIWQNEFIKNYKKLRIENIYAEMEELKKEAERLTNLYVAKAGQSEHQTGLAFDFGCYRNGKYYSDVSGSPEATWMYYNAYKYGFILRYPQDKEEITGYNFEPWHIRWVGDVSKDFYIDGSYITLEEYISQYKQSKKLFLK